VVAAAEIGRMLAVCRQRVTRFTAKPDFAAPVATLSAGRVWSYADGRAWAERTGRAVHPIGPEPGGRVVAEG
jgi:hypothetical protein